jgi:SAM-dependent methyltransferase
VIEEAAELSVGPGSARIRHMNELDVDAYRRHNLDLAELNEEQLRQHFARSGRSERRIFRPVENTTHFLSMKWLRGCGLEVGAGRYPTPLFGETSCLYGDLPGGEFFGQDKLDIIFNLNDEPDPDLKDKFSFVVCSHVMEHVDSFLNSLRYLKTVVPVGGIIYIIVPDRSYLEDAYWMPDIDFDHHLTEEQNPLYFAEEHDQRALAASRSQREKMRQSPENLFEGQSNAQAMLDIIESNSITDHRFVFHKHTYDFGGWVQLLVKAVEHIGGMKIGEIRYGYHRMDCHFVLEKTA